MQENSVTIFEFLGGEFIGPVTLDCLKEFHFTTFAETAADAENTFSVIFPDCLILERRQSLN